jgi:carboxypeptidase Q
MKALRIAIPLLLLGAGPVQAQVAQERVDLAVIERIREEGLSRSQIERIAGHLTDVIGPRLTGSPQMKQANEWTAQQLRTWGLENVVVEPWGEFGRGWEVVASHARLLAPFVMPLDVYPLAWSGSTRGMVSGPAVIIEAASVDELRSKYRGRLKGAFVLTGEPIELEPEYTLRPRRLAADSLFAPAPQPPAGGRAGGRPQPTAEQQQRFAVAAALDSMMRVEGAVSLRSSP